MPRMLEQVVGKVTRLAVGGGGAKAGRSPDRCIPYRLSRNSCIDIGPPSMVIIGRVGGGIATGLRFMAESSYKRSISSLSRWSCC